MAQAPLPNGAGGYQFNDGNTGEALLFVQGAPTALTAAATVTAAQLANGLFTFNGTAGAMTLPTVALLEAEVSSATKTNAAFTFAIVNTDNSDAVTVTAGTGWTLVGTAAVSAGTSSQWLARKTGDSAWTAYRIA